MEGRGLVLGLYRGEKEGEFSLTAAAAGFQSSKFSGLSDLVKVSGLASKKGNCRVFFGQTPDYAAVAVVDVGKKSAGFNEQEEVDEGRENVRTAVAAGVRQLQEAGVKSVDVDPCGDPEAAAEGAYLGTYYFDMLKKDKKPAPELNCYKEKADKKVEAQWNRGKILAEGQNFSRDLMETPANHMTPTRMGEIATEKLGKLPNVTVQVRDRAWAEEKKMFAFLSVANGSDQPPKFLEIEYKGRSDDSPAFALVGKGITFDSGGISIKPSLAMDEMRADMGGAACVLASIYTAARLKVPINVKGYCACTENMPSGKATKPGDVVTSMSGKTIQIDNTDAEGRLVLSDALWYAQTFKPSGVIDMATLTGAMCISLGTCATGVFTNSSYLWENMHKAGIQTGDRVWRMPVFNHFSRQVQKASPTADINNIAGNRLGGSCIAAAFLKEFVTHDRWMHMDIAGVMSGDSSDVAYLPKGMSGRPTRTVVEFLNMISK